MDNYYTHLLQDAKDLIFTCNLRKREEGQIKVERVVWVLEEINHLLDMLTQFYVVLPPFWLMFHIFFYGQVILIVPFFF